MKADFVCYKQRLCKRESIFFRMRYRNVLCKRSFFLGHFLCGCVCVFEKEREREKEKNFTHCLLKLQQRCKGEREGGRERERLGFCVCFFIYMLFPTHSLTHVGAPLDDMMELKTAFITLPRDEGNSFGFVISGKSFPIPAKKVPWQ